MHTKKIPVRITPTGQTMKVAAFDKRAEHITVVLGKGMQTQTTGSGLAFCGK